MKKTSILIAFLLSVAFSYGQLNPIPRGNQNQIDQFRGVIQGLKGSILGVQDTTNNPLTPYYGALTVLPDDSGKDTIPIWMSNGLKWIRFSGSNAFNINDTIYTEIPIAVKVDSVGRRIIYLLHLDGIVSPGYVVWTGMGLNFNVTPATYYINYNFYSSPFSLVTLAAAPVTDSRQDLFAVDTIPRALALTGEAGPSPPIPQTNPSSQLPLTSVIINAGDTVPSGVQLETIYNEHIAPPTEWTPTASGTGTTNFDNTDFPYIGSKAAFTPSYENGYAITFTKGTGTDTVQTGAIIRGFVSFNIPFTGQFQFQWFNGSTPVSNGIAINAGYGINPNNLNQYQIFAIPLNAWNFSSAVYNKLVITMAGTDTSGAGGFYLDYLQIQTGLLNIDQTPPPAWLLNGNPSTNPNIHFIGTTDPNPLRFKVNNVHAGWIGTANSFDMSMGYNTLPLSSVVFHDNTAFGANTLSRTNTLGFGNVAVGTYALDFNTSGGYNVAAGVAALFSNSTGRSNTAIGTNALYNNTTGYGNVAFGDSAMRNNTTGNKNSSLGDSSLISNTTGSYNIGLGYRSGIGFNGSNTLYVSDSTYHGYWKGLDSADGTAPNLIGIDASGFVHRYQNSGGGGGSETMQQTFENSVAAGDSTAIDLTGHRFRINEYLNIFPSSFGTSLNATDGASANAGIQLNADTANNLVTIQIRADKNTDVEGEAQISLDGMASTIVLQADSGSVFSQGIVKILDVPNGASTDSVLTINPDTRVINMRSAASFGSSQTMQQTFDNSVTAGDDPIISIGSHVFSMFSGDSLFFNADPGAHHFETSVEGTFDAAEVSNHSKLITDIGAGTGNETNEKSTAEAGSAYWFVGTSYNDGETDGSLQLISDPTGTFIQAGARLQLNVIQSGTSTDSVLTINAATGIVNRRDAASFGSNETLQQAFNKSILASDNPVINTGSDILNIAGTSVGVLQVAANGSGVAAFFANVTGSGNAITATTDDGYAISVSSTTGSAGFFNNNDDVEASVVLFKNSSIGNTVQPSLRLQRTSFGTPADGIGESIQFNLGGVAQNSNEIISKYTDLSGQTSEFSILGVNAATPTILLTISGAGIFTLVQGLPTFANNAAALLGGLTSNQLYRVSVAGTSTVAIVE